MTREEFDNTFYIREVGHELWQAFLIRDGVPVSPKLPSINQVFNYVKDNMWDSVV